MPEARSSTENPDPTQDSTAGSPPEWLGWWSLTPSLSIAVFLLVALFTLDSSGSSRIGLALIVGVLVGPPASYLLNTYWPRIATEDRTAPEAPNPKASP